MEKPKISGLNQQEKIEHYVCFVLATLSYLETLLERLIVLFKLFPLSIGKLTVAIVAWGSQNLIN